MPQVRQIFPNSCPGKDGKTRELLFEEEAKREASEKMKEDIKILAIESSCDETAAAVVKKWQRSALRM